MTADTQHRHDHTFWIGLLAGTAIGAGLVMWLLPQAREELRERVSDSASHLRTLASEQYQQASTRVGETVAAVNSAVAEVTS
jgi:gas vesicle protein